MPEETSFTMKNSRAAEILAATEKLPPQTVLDVRRGVSLRRTRGGIPVLRFHYVCHPERDPELNPDWIAKERRKYTSQAAWDSEQEIMDEAGGGELVFADTLVKYWDKIVITDPAWRPDAEWAVHGGMDHGKTNPTALLRGYIDFEGTIYFAGEYYQPGKEVWQHAPMMKRMPDFTRMDPCYADPTIFYATSQQSQRPGQAIERAKSVGELYEEQGIKNFVGFCGDRSDVSFAARLMLHWADLENREPTVRIVCRNHSESPQFGLHPWDCPNLPWELMRARRQRLSAQQLFRRNTSEAIVDKDNHARDAMKYVIMSHPEPAQKTLERRVSERFAERYREDPTTAVVEYTRIVHEEAEEEANKPIYYSRRMRPHVRRNQRRRLRGGW